MRKSLAALAAAAFAPLAAAQSGGSVYVAASGGEATYDIECATPLSCKKTDKAYKAALGWQFNRHLAAELGFSDLGQADLKGAGFGAHLHATAYELSAVGTYPVYSVFSLLGRLGLIRSTTKYGQDLGGEVSSIGPTYGAGVQLDFSKNVAARLQWQRYRVKSQISGQSEESGDVDMLSIGLVLHAR